MFTPTSRFPLIRAFLAVVVISLAFGDATNRRALAQTPNTSPADILDAAPQGLPPLPGKCAGPLGERDIDTIARYILSDPDRDSTLRACTEQISSDSARRITSRLNELGGVVSDQSAVPPWGSAVTGTVPLTESSEPAVEQGGGVDDVWLAPPTDSRPLSVQPSTGKLIPDPGDDVGPAFNSDAEKAAEIEAIEDLTSDTAPGDVSSTSDAADVPNALTATTTIMRETFEGEFPSGLWRISDGDGSTNGNYYWNDTSYRDSSYQPHGGNWSAWPAANALNPAQNYYANNMRSWMVYGPFDLRSATSAKLKFWYWNKSESNYDFFKWVASADGTNFYGKHTSGNSGGWRYVEFDLSNVHTIGSLLGDGDVWIAFYFSSDGSTVDDGPFVDDVELVKESGGSAGSCPNQYKAEYYNNRSLSGNPTLTRCENWPISYDWGSANPASGIGTDNFSVRWTGTASISAGTYTFLAAADDGIRVWLDNSLIIDAWRDQGPTAYRTTRTVNSGNHSVRVEYYEYGGGAVAQFAWSPAVSNGVPGIAYSMRDGFNVFKIDMWSSNLSFDTIMARDATSGNTTYIEHVGEMVGRSPYASRNPVLAFNADYFGENHHGAEGLIVKNGTRLPNAGTHNGTEWQRSSLSISNSKAVRIGVQTDCKGPPATACTNWRPDSSAYYNTVGGGPLFVQNGVRIGGANSTIPCANEALTTSYCNGTFKWTAAGISSNGRHLIVIVSNVTKTMDQAATVLISEGASRAIKFDGGGSTQVWYKPNGTVVGGGRRVTNALAVFSSQ